MNQKTLEDVIKTVRVSVVADVCGVSQRAIYKWMDTATGSQDRCDKISDERSRQRAGCQWRCIQLWLRVIPV